jgi:DNA mismatch endonuclease (patch repair protein)
MDNVSREVRSRTMAAVRSTGTSAEEAVRRLVREAGFVGYRRYWRVSGKPDFAWPGRRIALFVDGCFWHGCPKCCRLPASNQPYWVNKISRNRARDQRNGALLRKEGWRVIRVFECEIRRASFMRRLAILMLASSDKSQV